MTKAHKDLLKLSKEKRKSDLKPFAETVAKERRLIQLVDGLEKERAELVRIVESKGR